MYATNKREEPRPREVRTESAYFLNVLFKGRRSERDATDQSPEPAQSSQLTIEGR